MKSSNKSKRWDKKYLVLQETVYKNSRPTYYQTDFLLLALYRMITLKRSNKCRLRSEWR